MQAAMVDAPIISSTSQGEILENYMDETVEKPVESYGAAKSAVKQSFLQRMVGPAFATSLLAAVATVMPFPAGAYDQVPTMVGDFGVNPSVIDPSNGFPTVDQYFMVTASNILLFGLLVGALPLTSYISKKLYQRNQVSDAVKTFKMLELDKFFTKQN